MAVKIRLKRMGKIRTPFYRVVVADSRTKRDGRAIEEIGKYNPAEEPSIIEIDSERALYWLSVGAQPTEQVEALLKLTGDWAKFKGEDDTESKVKYAEPKEAFEADANKKPVLIPKEEKPAEEKPEEKKAEETSEGETPAEEKPAEEKAAKESAE